MHDTKKVFWNEFGQGEHFVQFYEEDSMLMSTLENFIGPGLLVDDCAVVIATEAHLNQLATRLKIRGVNLADVISRNVYIPLNAVETMARFMNKGWPDQSRFLEVAQEIFARVPPGNRRLRLFGEMVALLWAEGNRPATIRLEKLWNDLAKKESFSLFCAYPRHAFTAKGCQSSMMDICASHSHVVSATGDFEVVSKAN